jgi:hypothetical protein
MMTDEGSHYTVIGRDFGSHQSVNHNRDEWVRGEVHTNTIEGYYSVFKRGMKGVIAKRSICTDIYLSLTSATATALPLALMTWRARIAP